MSNWVPTGESTGCHTCRHLDRATFTCAAYQNGPPLPIASGEVDHHVPRPGQAGTDVWTALPRRLFARAAAASETPEPLTDLLVSLGGRRHGIHVVVLTHQPSEQLNVPRRTAARLRRWATGANVLLHTVAVDMRGHGLYSGHGYYYRSGIRSMSLDRMARVSDAAHLRQLVQGAR